MLNIALNFRFLGNGEGPFRSIEIYKYFIGIGLGLVRLMGPG
jgi:hypothetical protein